MVEDSEKNPVVVQRRCGGWLAYSNRESRLQIGVIAGTADEARHRYEASVVEWCRNIDAGSEIASTCV
jgi:hypothetical protein